MPAVIQSVQSLSRLETTSMWIEKIVDLEKNNNNKIQQFLFGDKILLIAHGQVIAGIDFSKFSEKNVSRTDDKLTVTLPQPEIFQTILDVTKTQVYDRTTGLLNKGGDKDLETQARQQAVASIRKAACDGDILRFANQNAQKQITTLLRNLGFNDVTVKTQTANCVQ